MTTLYNGDCLEVLKKIKDNSIDLLLTDPPYLFVKSGSNDKRINRGVYDRNKEIKKNMSNFNQENIYNFLDIVNKKLKKTNIYIFCSKLQIPFYLNWSLENKKKFDVLIWDKGRNGLLSHSQFATNIEYIIRIYENGLNAVKKDNKLISEYYQKIQKVKSDNGKEHPAQKPIELLKRFILLSSNEKQTVLDCYMGSGSTGVACRNLDRNFIGIELDENYFKIAEKRINGAENEKA